MGLTLESGRTTQGDASEIWEAPKLEGYTASPNKSEATFPWFRLDFRLNQSTITMIVFISILWYSMVISSPVLGMIGIMGQQQEFLIVTFLGLSKSWSHGFHENEPDETIEKDQVKKHAHGISMLLNGQYWHI